MRYLLLISVIILSFTGLFQPRFTDELVFSQVANIWYQGGIPYRDIFDHKPPGVYLPYFLAIKLGISTTGNIIIFVRSVILFLNTISAVLTYLIIIRSHSKKVAVFALISYLILNIYFQGQYALSEPVMVTFLLLAYYLITTDSQSSDLKIVLTGICIGIAGLFKQTAIANLIAVIIWIIYYHRLIEQAAGRLLKTLTLIFSGILITWLPTTYYFYINNAFPDYWYSIITFNLSAYPPMWQQSLIQSWKFLNPLIIWLVILKIYIKLNQNTSVTNKPDQYQVTGSNPFHNKNNYYILTLLYILIPLPLIFSRPYHHYWVQILPFIIILATQINIKNNPANNSVLI